MQHSPELADFNGAPTADEVATAFNKQEKWGFLF